jgi:hypothetical protein
MKLQSAGNGLPDMERLFIKNVLVPNIKIFIGWNIALFLLKKELRIIGSLVNSMDKNKLTQKVIIDRTFAIEDHSRQFSINMVLEHLVIAGTKVKNVIETLTQEKEFEEDIKIENVKPKKNIQDEYTEFIAFYDEYISYIKNHSKNQSLKRKRHPWFVEFNNCDWSIFMYMHTFIHRRQIEAIIKELK